jgi:hypothetical protein
MTIPLFDLVTRLEIDVPAQDSTPTDAQYVFAVRDAVGAFGIKVGRKKHVQLNVVAGTASYALPADYLKVITLKPITETHEGVLVNSQGVIPLDTGLLSDTWTIAGKTITFYPVPTYTLARNLWYKAGYALTTDPDTDDPVYADMTEEEADIILLKAQATAWRAIGGKVSSSQAWKYQIGDVTIDKTNLGKSLTGWIADLDKAFESRVKDYIGPVGMLC